MIIRKKTLYSAIIIFVLLISLAGFSFYKKIHAEKDKLYVIDYPDNPDHLKPIENGERQAQYNALFNESVANLIYNIGLELNKKDGYVLRLHEFGSALTYKMLRNGSNEDYDKIKSAILGENEQLSNYLIGFFGDIPTKDSLNILLYLANRDKSINVTKDRKNAVYGAIARMPESLSPSDGIYSPEEIPARATELSSQLEEALKKIEFQEETIRLKDYFNSSFKYDAFIVYTNSIIEFGSQSGMKLLFDDLKQSKISINYGIDDSGFMNYNLLINNHHLQEDTDLDVADFKAFVILSYLGKFRNIYIVPFIAKYLDDAKINNPILFGAVYALMSMGQPEGTKLVLEWVANREDDILPILNITIELIRDESSLDLLKEYAVGNKSSTFKNEQNKKTILLLYKKYLSDRGMNEN